MLAFSRFNFDQSSSKKTKRPYRKGNPIPSKERQQAYLSRKSETHKALSAVIRIP
ncbi:hypothetical protein ONJ16_27570, partial [Salmonella enterica subsp. enterica serovar Montevideo]|nr:hypothetical protein [Salmonella enterica subsp. enterica serovar Montevideo]